MTPLKVSVNCKDGYFTQPQQLKLDIKILIFKSASSSHDNWTTAPTITMNLTDQSGCCYPKNNYSPGEKWIKDLTKQRLNNFQGGHFSDVNLSSVLFTHRLDGQKFVELKV